MDELTGIPKPCSYGILFGESNKAKTVMVRGNVLIARFIRAWGESQAFGLRRVDSIPESDS
ncbi:hypothetical protein D3H35_19360 [Cohnella faecalis]|uniref:Uncharacterized protein n=1 Tax=Cohnella faecalis TaxID=2315694 RepID=A0A398CKB1_9BACL|nr:hypothetical protein D3H35_19360 [Cohnella faecalis]